MATTITTLFANYSAGPLLDDDDDDSLVSPREILRRSHPFVLKTLEWCLRLICFLTFAVGPWANYKLIRFFHDRPFYKRSSVKWYIMFKAVCDSMFLFVSAPIVFCLTFRVDLVHRNTFTCKIAAYFHYFADDMISMLLTLACIDRMLRITCGYRFRTRISLIVCQLVTIFFVIFNLHHIFRLKFVSNYCQRQDFLFFETKFDLFYSYVYTGVTLVIIFICSVNLGISTYCDRIQRSNLKEQNKTELNQRVRPIVATDRLNLVEHMDEWEEPPAITIEKPENQTEIVEEQEQQDSVDLQLTICVLITSIAFLVCVLPNFAAVITRHKPYRVISMSEYVFGHIALFPLDSFIVSLNDLYHQSSSSKGKHNLIHPATMKSTTLLICFGALLYFVAFASACCKHHHIGTCCGNGKCNIFCCNCDGGCDENCRNQWLSDLASNGQGSKFRKPRRRGGRDVDNELNNNKFKREISLDYFQTVDKNSDGKIDLSEAIIYAFSNNAQLDKTFKNATLWFDPMDTNENGFIEPEEFDYSLA